MISLGVEASTAAATAADGAAPTSFLDGLLAALNANAPVAPVDLDQSTTAPTAIGPESKPESESTVAAIAVPQLAVATADVEAIASAVAAPEPIADAAADAVQGPDVPPVEVAGSSVTTVRPAKQPVWSVSAYPGEPETLHSAGVESSAAPVCASQTPQHHRPTHSDESAGAAETATTTTPAPAMTATANMVTANAAMPTDLTPKNSTPKNSTTKNAAATTTAATVVERRSVPIACAPVGGDTVDSAPVVSDTVDSDPVDGDTVDMAHVESSPSLATPGDGTAPQPADAGAATAASASVQPRPNRHVVALNGPQPLRNGRMPSTSAVALIEAGIRRQPSEPVRHDTTNPHEPAALSGVTSVVTDRVDPAPSVATDAPPAPKTATIMLPASGPRPTAPANLGMIGVDRVRFAREQAPSRAVQRLAIDLDGAQVAVRFHGDHVAVDVLNDPSGSLGNGWARQVERSLDQAVRTVSEPQRGGQSSDQRGSQPGDTSRRGANTPDGSDEGQRHSKGTFTLFAEEED